MSAFSSLFGSSKIDESVDSLLKSSAGPVQRQDLRARTVVKVPKEVTKEPKSKSEEASEEASESQSEASGSEASESESESEAPEQDRKKLAKQKRKEEENESLESEYYSKLLKEDEPKEEAKVEEAKEESGSDSESEDEKKESKKQSKAKSVDLKEEELNKADRTVFVGNVSNTVITSKTTYKQFKKLFSALGKVQSVRFRSIAFDEAVPRKVAFVKKSLHSTRDTVNAYVVFKDKEPSNQAAKKLNATVFDHHHLRVDHVAHPAPKDNKRTIFVGNLDFEEAEETLWRYFNSKVDDDVESVRVVRDSKTNLGKGFALVQFKDSLSVNKAMLLHDKPMPSEDKKKKARKLRISRAKANVKPSILSPNHVDNARKSRKPKAVLTDDQKTKLGRAKSLLGKSDRSTAGKLVVEGTRATKGLRILGIKGMKSAQGRIKKPRITDRSTRFKKDKAEFTKIGQK